MFMFYIQKIALFMYKIVDIGTIEYEHKPVEKLNALYWIFAIRNKPSTDIMRSLAFIFENAMIVWSSSVIDLMYIVSDIKHFINDKVGIIAKIGSSLYVFIAMIMFFRIAFALLGYLINPDKIEDSKVGAGKLISNIIVTLILVIFMPKIFDLAMDLQQVLIGRKVYVENVKLLINETFDSVKPLVNVEVKRDGLIYKLFFNASDVKSNDNFAIHLGRSMQCLSMVSMENDKNSGLFDVNFIQSISGISTTKILEGYCSPAPNKSYYSFSSLLGMTALLNQTTLFNLSPLYNISYIYPLSTIMVIAMFFMCVKFIFKITVRSFKLFFYELISPIAVISILAPKSMEEGIFKKWLNETVKTYLSLFIHMFVFMFLSVIIKEIKINNVGFFPFIFFILAIFSFFKEMPKILEKIFNISVKPSGTFLKKMGAALVGGGIAAAAGGITAAKAGLSFTEGAMRGAKHGMVSGFSSGKMGQTAFNSAIHGGDPIRTKYGIPAPSEAFIDNYVSKKDSQKRLDVKNANQPIKDNNSFEKFNLAKATAAITAGGGGPTAATAFQNRYNAATSDGKKQELLAEAYLEHANNVGISTITTQQFQQLDGNSKISYANSLSTQGLSNISLNGIDDTLKDYNKEIEVEKRNNITLTHNINTLTEIQQLQHELTRATTVAEQTIINSEIATKSGQLINLTVASADLPYLTREKATSDNKITGLENAITNHKKDPKNNKGAMIDDFIKN